LLARELLNGTSLGTNIAFVSTPSVFVAAKNLVAEMPVAERPNLMLLEFDERFRVFPQFVFYDYRRPFKLPGNNNPPDYDGPRWVVSGWEDPAKLTRFMSLQLA